MNILVNTLPEDLPTKDIYADYATKAADTAAKLYGVTEDEVSIILTDDAHIHELNNRYRHIDRPTDVLSFAFNESDEPPVDKDAPSSLGEIIISVERALAQAEEYGHSPEREVSFLTVHGMLHLLGYDHMEEAERLEMEQEQRFVMEKLGIARQ